MFMKISQHAIIAGVIISLMLIFSFAVFQIFLIQSKIILKENSTIIISPKNGYQSSTQSSNNFPIASQTSNPPGVFSLGMKVRVFKTDGDGLIIRSSVGFNGIPIYLGLEMEEFEIIEGPKIIDSEIWWRIASIEDPQKVGWAVQDYLDNSQNLK